MALGFACFILPALPGETPAISSGAPVSVPGTKVVASLGDVCPKDPPLAIDCNDDGVDDLLIPAYQVGPFSRYLPPEAGAAFGLVGSLMSMKAFTDNANFTRAGVIDGKTHTMLWTFQTGGMIDSFLPSAEHKRLYIASQDDRLTALDLAKGGVVWQHDLKANITGLAMSQGAIVAASAHDVVLGINPVDGVSLWEKHVKLMVMSPGFGVMIADDKGVYLSTLDNAVRAFEPVSGKERWVYKTEGNPSLRLLTGGVLLVADRKNLLALNTDSGGLRWKLAAGGHLHIDPFVDLGDLVVFVQSSGDSKLAALDPGSGNLRWSVDFSRAVQDKVRKIVTPEDTELRKTALVVKRDAAGHAELLFAASSDRIEAVHASDGKEAWSAPIEEAQVMLLAGDRLVAADSSKVIHSLDAADGTVRWTYDARKDVAQLAHIGDTLYATLYSKDLLALRFADGTLEGKIPLGEPYRLVPEKGDRLIVCSEWGTQEVDPATRP